MRKYIHLTEVIAWLIIVSVSSVWFYHYYTKPIKKENLLKVTFADIDGVVIGTPVNFMGVNIGTVEDLEQNGRNITIYFSKKRGLADLPKGSTVNIEFTGLVGSKTLEIEPPKNVSAARNAPALIANEPVRITGFFEASAKSFEAIASGSQNFVNLFGAGSVLKIKQKFLRINRFTYKAIAQVDDKKRIIRDFNVKMTSMIDDITFSMSNYISTTDKIIYSLNTNDYDANTRSVLGAVKSTMFYTYTVLTSKTYESALEDLIIAGKSINKRMDTNNLMHFKSFKAQTYINKLDKVNLEVSKVKYILKKANNTYKKWDLNLSFNNIIKFLNDINLEIEKWNKRI